MDYIIICVRLTCEDCILHIGVNFYMWGSTITRGCRLLQVRKKYFMYDIILLHVSQYMDWSTTTYTGQLLHTRVNYIHGSITTYTGQLHTRVNYYIHGSITTYTGQLLHTQVNYYIHGSITTYTGQLLHAQIDYCMEG
jgi:hypothetical protein